MGRIILIGLGGALGAICRFAMIWGVQSYFAGGFPLGTLFVNVLGGVAIGFVMESFRNLVPPGYLAPLVVTGFLGAFTTFSTFSWETFQLIRENALGMAILSVFGNVFICLLAVWVGSKLALVQIS